MKTLANPLRLWYGAEIWWKTVSNYSYENIRYNSYALVKIKFVNGATMEKTADKVAKMLWKLKHSQAPIQLNFFFDEKELSQDPKVNKKK